MPLMRHFKRLGTTWRLAAGVAAAVSDRNLDLISAGVAFWSLLAIFPGVAAVIAFWGFLADPASIEMQLGALKGFVPGDAYTLLTRQVGALIETAPSTLGLATLLSTGAALWSTRAGVGALLRGLNAAYGTQPRAGLWPTVWALVMTLALVSVSLFALASVVVAPVALSYLPFGELTQTGLLILRWTLNVLVILPTLGLLYRYGPNHAGARRPAWISPDALLAMVIWAAASAGFTVYLANFGNYNEIYGSIGAVIALLMWFFISAFTVLLGAAWNAEIARLRGRDYRVRGAGHSRVRAFMRRQIGPRRARSRGATAPDRP